MNDKQSLEPARYRVADAALRITLASKRYVADASLRKAAKLIGALETDAEGRAVIAEPVIDRMTDNFSKLGVLVGRNASAEAVG